MMILKWCQSNMGDEDISRCCYILYIWNLVAYLELLHQFVTWMICEKSAISWSVVGCNPHIQIDAIDLHLDPRSDILQ